MKRCPFAFFVTLLVLLITGCGNDQQKKAPPDTPYKGVLYISCDESFKPVMDQQAVVYQGLYPETRLVISYKPEAECLKDILVDSVQMVIATRTFSRSEADKVTDSFALQLKDGIVAHDLIAVIVHPNAKDSFFSMNEIRQLLTGKLKENLIPVLDGRVATSTVRFVLDSVLYGENFGTNVVAAQSSAGVIDYVSKTPNAVGFIGFGWIGNMDDTGQAVWRRKVKTAYLESTDSVNAYVTPSQLFIYTGTYPMVRDLVYIMKEKHYGIAHGFAKFLESMRGQLLFRRSYIMPVILPNYLREAELKDTINKY